MPKFLIVWLSLCRLFFDTISVLSSLRVLRSLAKFRMRTISTELLVVSGFLALVGCATELSGPSIFDKLLMIGAVFVVYMVMMSTKLRVLAPGYNVMLTFSRRRAALHLLRPSPGDDLRLLWPQLAAAVSDALDSGVIAFVALSPLLLKRGHRRHLVQALTQELESHPDVAGFSFTYGKVQFLNRLDSVMYRLAYQDAMPAVAERYLSERTRFERYLPLRLRLVPGINLVVAIDRSCGCLRPAATCGA